MTYSIITHYELDCNDFASRKQQRTGNQPATQQGDTGRDGRNIPK